MAEWLTEWAYLQVGQSQMTRRFQSGKSLTRLFRLMDDDLPSEDGMGFLLESSSRHVVNFGQLNFSPSIFVQEHGARFTDRET